MAYGAAVTMAGKLMPFLQKIATNPNMAATATSAAASGLPALLRGDILGAVGGAATGAATGYGMGALTGRFIPGATNLVGGMMKPSPSVMTNLIPSLAGAAVPVATGLATNAVLNRGVNNLAGQALGGLTGAAGQTGQNAIGLLGYHAVTGEPLYGTAVPQGTGQYGGVPPVGGSALDVIQAGGPAGAQRLTTVKNAQTMADALNAYMPTVRKFAEQAKKDDFERSMAAEGIKRNILTNAEMLMAAQKAGLDMGTTGAQQAGQALTTQYSY